MSVAAVADTHTNTHTHTFIDQLPEVFVTLHRRVRNRQVKGSNGHFSRLAVVFTYLENVTYFLNCNFDHLQLPNQCRA
jgi:hypothetical protein